MNGSFESGVLEVWFVGNIKFLGCIPSHSELGGGNLDTGKCNLTVFLIGNLSKIHFVLDLKAHDITAVWWRTE